MDSDHQNTSAHVEQTPGHSVGLGKFGHDAGALLCLDGGDRVLSTWLRRQEQTVRQQLREFCDEAKAKRGDQRQAFCVERCCVPRLA
jgi:hypothetical protein